MPVLILKIDNSFFKKLIIWLESPIPIQQQYCK